MSLTVISKFKDSLVSLKTRVVLLILMPSSLSNQNQTQSSSLTVSGDLEAAAPHQNQQDEESPNTLRWTVLVATFCFSSAVQTGEANYSLVKGGGAASLQFDLYRLMLVFSVSAMFIGKCVASWFRRLSCGLMRAGIVFGLTAAFLTLTTATPLAFEVTSWVIYVITVSAGFLYAIRRDTH